MIGRYHGAGRVSGEYATPDHMNTQHNNSHDRREQVSASKATQIKLGIDVHADFYVVVRQVDGQHPQPPQKFTATEFLDWARRQCALAVAVHSCYEAGAFGYLRQTMQNRFGLGQMFFQLMILDRLNCRAEPVLTNCGRSNGRGIF